MIHALRFAMISGLMLAHGAAFAQTITESDILEAQEVWGNGIVAIGNAFTNGGDYEALATDHVRTLYAYEAGIVLFKPTKAAEDQFRLTEDEAISYFIGGIVPEDTGFALQPWTNVRFENAGVIIDTDSATAMGNYYFTDAETNEEAKVEYTFGYVRDETGALVINVHHSAFPYHPTK